MCRSFPWGAQEEHVRQRERRDVWPWVQWVAMREARVHVLTQPFWGFSWQSLSFKRVISSLQTKHSYLAHKAAVGFIEIHYRILSIGNWLVKISQKVSHHQGPGNTLPRQKQINPVSVLTLKGVKALYPGCSLLWKKNCPSLLGLSESGVCLEKRSISAKLC